MQAFIHPLKEMLQRLVPVLFPFHLLHYNAFRLRQIQSKKTIQIITATLMCCFLFNFMGYSLALFIADFIKKLSVVQQNNHQVQK